MLPIFKNEYPGWVGKSRVDKHQISYFVSRVQTQIYTSKSRQPLIYLFDKCFLSAYHMQVTYHALSSNDE